MNFRTQIDGVNVINGHLALFGPYYVGIVDNVKLKYMSTKRMKPTQPGFKKCLDFSGRSNLTKD